MSDDKKQKALEQAKKRRMATGGVVGSSSPAQKSSAGGALSALSAGFQNAAQAEQSAAPQLGHTGGFHAMAKGGKVSVEVGEPKIDEAQSGDVLPGLDLKVESPETRLKRLKSEDLPVQDDPAGNALVGGLAGGAASSVLPASEGAAPSVLKYGKELLPDPDKTMQVAIPKLSELNEAAAARLAARPKSPAYFAEGGEVGRHDKALTQAKARRAGVAKGTEKLKPMAEVDMMVSHLKDPDIKEFEPQHDLIGELQKHSESELTPLELQGAKYQRTPEVALAHGGSVEHPQSCACGACLSRGGFTSMKWREPHHAHVVHAARIIVDHHMQALAEGGPVAAAIPPAVQDGQPPAAQVLQAPPTAIPAPGAPAQPEIAKKDEPLVEPKKSELEVDPKLKEIEDERQKEVQEALHPSIGLQIRRALSNGLSAFGHAPTTDFGAQDRERANALTANAKERGLAYAQSMHATGMDPNSRRTQALTQAFGRVTGSPELFQGLDEGQLSQVAPLVAAVQNAKTASANAEATRNLTLGIAQMKDKTSRDNASLRANTHEDDTAFKHQKQDDLLESKAIADAERIHKDPQINRIMTLSSKAKDLLEGIKSGRVKASQPAIQSLVGMLTQMEQGGVASEHAAQDLGIQSPFMGLRQALATISPEAIDFQDPAKVVSVFGPLLQNTEQSIGQFQRERLQKALSGHTTQVPQERLDKIYEGLSGQPWQHAQKVAPGTPPPPLE